MSGCGPISHKPGTSAGIPPHLRGGAYRVIDSSMSGADTDIDSAAAHTIEGLIWTASSDSPTTAVATASGTQVVANTATVYELVAEIPDVTYDDHLPVIVELEPATMDKNSQTFWVKLAQGTGDTAEDVLVTWRRTGASAWRFRPGLRTGSGWTLGYPGDNPTATSLPGRIQIMITGHGNSWRVVLGTATSKPGFRGVTAHNSATCLITTKSASVSAGTTPPLMNRIKLGVNSYSGDIDGTFHRVIVYRAARSL